MRRSLLVNPFMLALLLVGVPQKAHSQESEQDSESAAETSDDDDEGPETLEPKPEHVSLRLRIDELSDKYSVAERELDRMGKLERELLGDTATGCALNEKISSMEVIISGTHLPRESRGKPKKPVIPESSPTAVHIELGNEMVIVNDEKTNNLFPGSVTHTGLAEKKIGEISQLKIRKLSGGYTNDKYTYRKWFKKKTRYKVHEVDIYKMETLEIKINGQTVYKNPEARFKFFSGSLVWQDPKFSSNEYWTRMMQRKDCAQTK